MNYLLYSVPLVAVSKPLHVHVCEYMHAQLTPILY